MVKWSSWTLAVNIMVMLQTSHARTPFPGDSRPPNATFTLLSLTPKRTSLVYAQKPARSVCMIFTSGRATFLPALPEPSHRYRWADLRISDQLLTWSIDVDISSMRLSYQVEGWNGYYCGTRWVQITVIHPLHNSPSVTIIWGFELRMRSW